MESDVFSVVEEDLGYFKLFASEILDGQEEQIFLAHKLDKSLRMAAKKLIYMTNCGELEADIKAVIDRILGESGQMFELRKLGRSSYLRFRALKEVIEALIYNQVAPFIFDGVPEPALHSLGKTLVKVGDREKEIFSHPELAGSWAQAYAEAIGEISKGIRKLASKVMWESDSAKCEEMLAVCRRGHDVAEQILSVCDELSVGYEHLIDKFFRRMISVMEGSVLYIAELTSKLQLAKVILSTNK
ncbi:hypothetical protein A3G55_02400 [Candidatus Giovannonibacteria bacterium RIFCSPLOWO2_12_FULL_44_25]|uniref:Uncharacterized protein n=4 Tax=Parcubacteria group TaxID=1794811 RepID=A0A837INP0_9BACT|nr:MAG: hypothetical protein UW15_C0001G0009 [Parcubacteria group bacterium GW2011_GWC1_44_10]KKT57530.1 MAG: hypothetical protein UW49_C0003G0009 [Candidatus Giovannonibacteria bacterium GW2011_GWB1_44_23]KKT59791.1 MAG: hypothetical protein UW53_C0007G0009 [Candidatus Giovannonibacteria bacterium GW2011_GWA1_44_25]KKU13118.1 MAG: hypothetical protein UX18_C0001G0009 [Candidatus Azambacteria bacterium GW2011_GWC2_45_7b]OGF49522.1 MAG: hypothetical protein A2120_00910 [Candidatus Giovannonibact